MRTKNKLESKAWTVFDFESAVDSEYYQLIIDAYNLLNIQGLKQLIANCLRPYCIHNYEPIQ